MGTHAGLTHYHYLDDSGDPGLSGSASASSHFALAMVQVTTDAPLPELAAIRRALHLAPTFEFKYHSMRRRQKMIFFESIQAIPFRVRVVVVRKSDLGNRFAALGGQDLIVEFILRLVSRASTWDIGNDVLIIDGATPALCRALRIRLSVDGDRSGRARPFKKIVGGKSRNEDGLQLADMIAGAVRHHVMGAEPDFYRFFAGKVVDLWQVPAVGQ
jgi:hypothetical protein